jgi:hypothetical protein
VVVEELEDEDDQMSAGPAGIRGLPVSAAQSKNKIINVSSNNWAPSSTSGLPRSIKQERQTSEMNSFSENLIDSNPASHYKASSIYGQIQSAQQHFKTNQHQPPHTYQPQVWKPVLVQYKEASPDRRHGGGASRLFLQGSSTSQTRRKQASSFKKEETTQSSHPITK